MKIDGSGCDYTPTDRGLAATAKNIRAGMEEALLCALDPDAARAAFDSLLLHLETAVPEYDAEMKLTQDGIGIRRAMWLTNFVEEE